SRTIAAGGVVDQAGHRAGAPRRRTSRAKRKTRADASHHGPGSGPAAGGQPAQAATGAGTLSPGIQRSASARSAEHANAGRRLSTIREEISVPSTGTGISTAHAGTQRATAWFSRLEATSGVFERRGVGRKCVLA